MSTLTAGPKWRWVWAAGGAVIAMGLLAVLFSVSLSRPAPQPLAAPRARPAIELAERRKKSALDDEATLLDPTPLFQPTHWNTAQLDVMPPELGGSFQNHREPAKFEFADSDLKLGQIPANGPPGKVETPVKMQTSLDLPAPTTVPLNATDVLATGLPGSILIGIGRVDQVLGPLAARGAIVDIVEVGTGRAALLPQAMAQVQALAAKADPPDKRPWKAMEFLAAVDAAGLAAPLTITRRSDVDEVDSYFRNFLTQTLRVGERLTPGFYRISIGP